MVQLRGGGGCAARPEGGQCIHVARRDAHTEGKGSALAKLEQTRAVLVTKRFRAAPEPLVPIGVATRALRSPARMTAP